MLLTLFEADYILSEVWIVPSETTTEFGNYLVILQIIQVLVGPACLASGVALGLRKV